MIRRTLALVCSLWFAGVAMAQGVPGAGAPMSPVSGIPISTVVQTNPGNGARNIVDGFGTTQFAIVPYTGASNYVNVQGMITGGGPVVFVDGTDANIDLNLTAKGTGAVTIGNGLGVNAQFSGPASGLSIAWANILGATNSGTPRVVFGANTTSGYANVYSELRSFSFGQTEPLVGAAVGYLNVPSGQRSFTGGSFNQATGYGSTALGNASTAFQNYSLVAGNQATDHSTTQIAYASGALTGGAAGSKENAGYSFQCSLVAGATCSLVSGTGSTTASVFNSIYVGLKKNVSARIIVTGRDTTNGDSATWFIQTAWSVNATSATAASLGSSGTGAPTYSRGVNAGLWTVALFLDTSGAAAFAYPKATGVIGSNTIEWHARVDASENTTQ